MSSTVVPERGLVESRNADGDYGISVASVSPLLPGFVDVACPASKDAPAWSSLVTAGLVTVFSYRRAEL